MVKSKQIIIKISNNGKRVSLDKGTETITLDIIGNRVHIWATHGSGTWTVATLEFLKDEVVQIE
jgi:hypothetical protein